MPTMLSIAVRMWRQVGQTGEIASPRGEPLGQSADCTERVRYGLPMTLADSVGSIAEYLSDNWVELVGVLTSMTFGWGH